TVGCTPHILPIERQASMTGLAPCAAHTASDYATHTSVRVSCSLWAILAQLILALPSSSGEGSGRPAAARHPYATPKPLICWANTLVATRSLCATIRASMNHKIYNLGRCGVHYAKMM